MDDDNHCYCLNTVEGETTSMDREFGMGCVHTFHRACLVDLQVAKREENVTCPQCRHDCFNRLLNFNHALHLAKGDKRFKLMIYQMGYSTYKEFLSRLEEAHYQRDKKGLRAPEDSMEVFPPSVCWHCRNDIMHLPLY
jgi:hypothetical protein